MFVLRLKAPIGLGMRLVCNRPIAIQEETMAQTPSSASRDAVRDTVPKMIDLTEKVLFGDVWERPNFPSATAA